MHLASATTPSPGVLQPSLNPRSPGKFPSHSYTSVTLRTLALSPVIFMTQHPAQKPLFPMKLPMTISGTKTAHSSGYPSHFPLFISDFPNCFPILCTYGILLHWSIRSEGSGCFMLLYSGQLGLLVQSVLRSRCGQIR